MKVAVQIFGHLRTFEQCAPKLKEFLLDVYETDVFIHSWDMVEHSTPTWHQAKDQLDIECKVDEDIINKVNELYNPKSLLIESQDIIDEPGFFGTDSYTKISMRGVKSMLYSMYKANELRLNYEQDIGIIYDYVVVIRPDIMPLIKLEITNYQNEFAFNPATSIHLLFNVYSEIREKKFFTFAGALDVFFLALPSTINKITECFLHFDQFFKDYPAKAFPYQVAYPELSLQEYILRSGIVPRFYQSYFIIKRKNNKDDIKLLPPTKIEHIMNLSSKANYWSIRIKAFIKNLMEYLLSIFRKIVPLFLRKLLFRVLSLITKLLNFIQNRCL